MGSRDVSDPWSDVVHDAPGLFQMCPKRHSYLDRLILEAPRYDLAFALARTLVQFSVTAYTSY